MKILALLVVYLVWGSTYLGVKIGLESLPPFLMLGARLLIAGGLLYLWSRYTGQKAPSSRDWKRAGITGSLLLVTGLGAVVWAVQTVPSGLAALLIATVPIWMVVMDFLKTRTNPGGLVWTGLALGLSGIFLLLSSLGELVPGSDLPIVGVGVVLLAAVSWAFGSLLSRSSDLPRHFGLSTGMQMLYAGIVLSVVGLMSGEQIALGQVTLRSGAAFVYLTLMGSLLAFSAYQWLLRNCDPGLVGTYAYVNPVVALILGCVWGGESIGPNSVVACLVTLLGVTLIVSGKLRGFAALEKSGKLVRLMPTRMKANKAA